jgi:hypothetical protein
MAGTTSERAVVVTGRNLALEPTAAWEALERLAAERGAPESARCE